MDFIIDLLVNAGILFLLAYLMPSVNIRNYTTAILVALVVGILNATIGFLIRLPLNLATLGLLSFIIRLIVTAIMIKIADKFFSGFEVRGFTPALIIAVVLALVGSFLTGMLHGAQG